MGPRHRGAGWLRRVVAVRVQYRENVSKARPLQHRKKLDLARQFVLPGRRALTPTCPLPPPSCWARRALPGLILLFSRLQRAAQLVTGVPQEASPKTCGPSCA